MFSPDRTHVFAADQADRRHFYSPPERRYVADGLPRQVPGENLAEVSTYSLPISIWPDNFRSLCKGEWDSVPEYIRNFCKVPDRVDKPTGAAERWLNRQQSPKRHIRTTSQATGSADGPADAGVQAGRL